MRDQDKGLSTGERKMLESAKQILISELELVPGMDREIINCKLGQIFNEPSECPCHQE